MHSFYIFSPVCVHIAFVLEERRVQFIALLWTPLGNNRVENWNFMRSVSR
jgi:hypothetical protein